MLDKSRKGNTRERKLCTMDNVVHDDNLILSLFKYLYIGTKSMNRLGNYG